MDNILHPILESQGVPGAYVQHAQSLAILVSIPPLSLEGLRLSVIPTLASSLMNDRCPFCFGTFSEGQTLETRVSPANMESGV